MSVLRFIFFPNAFCAPLPYFFSPGDRISSFSLLFLFLSPFLVIIFFFLFTVWAWRSPHKTCSLLLFPPSLPPSSSTTKKNLFSGFPLIATFLAMVHDHDPYTVRPGVPCFSFFNLLGFFVFCSPPCWSLFPFFLIMESHCPPIEAVRTFSP